MKNFILVFIKTMMKVLKFERSLVLMKATLLNLVTKIIFGVLVQLGLAVLVLNFIMIRAKNSVVVKRTALQVVIVTDS